MLLDDAAETPRDVPRLTAGLAYNEGRDDEVTMARGPSGKVYRGRSFFCFRISSLPRRSAIRIVEHALFEPAVACVITFNCALLAWQSPLDPKDTWKHQFIASCALPLLIFFTIELLTKMLAFGVVGHRHAYLRDPYCQLDFLVVTTAWLPHIFPTLHNFTGIRAIRALRPLRTLHRLPGMPMLVSTILQAIRNLASVMMILIFSFVVFGIVGQGMFQGALHYRCTLPGTGEAGASGGAGAAAGGAPGEAGVVAAAAAAGAHRRLMSGRMLKGGGGGGAQVTFCNPHDPNACAAAGMPEGECVYYRDTGGYPLNDFDSTMNAIMGITQIATLDTWSPQMYDVMSGVTPYAWIYFVLAVWICGFCQRLPIPISQLRW